MTRASESDERVNKFLKMCLHSQCVSLPGVRCGFVVSANNAQLPVASLPANFTATPLMLAAAQRALAGRCESKPAGTDPADGQRVSMPVRRAGKVLGAIVLEANTHTDEQRAALRCALQNRQPPARANGDTKATAADNIEPNTNVLTNAAIGEQVSAPATPPQAGQQQLAVVIDLLASCMDASGFERTVLLLCNELASRFRCERVSIGIVDGPKMNLAAMSHSADVDGRSNLATDICFAMSEAADQGRAIAFPAIKPAGDLNVAQAALARRERCAFVLSLPLVEHGEVVGALTLQREHEEAFDNQTLATLEAFTTLAAPVLALKRRDDRSPLRYTLDRGAAFAKTPGRSPAHKPQVGRRCNMRTAGVHGIGRFTLSGDCTRAS